MSKYYHIMKSQVAWRDVLPQARVRTRAAQYDKPPLPVLSPAERMRMEAQDRALSRREEKRKAIFGLISEAVAKGSKLYLELAVGRERDSGLERAVLIRLLGLGGFVYMRPKTRGAIPTYVGPLDARARFDAAFPE